MTTNVDRIIDELLFEYLVCKNYTSTLNAFINEAKHWDVPETNLRPSASVREASKIRDDIRQRVISYLLSSDCIFSITSPIRKIQAALTELRCALNLSCVSSNRSIFSGSSLSMPLNQRNDTGTVTTSSLHNSNLIKRKRPRLRRSIRAVCDLQKWHRALEHHVTSTQVPDTFAQAINESRQISSTGEPNVTEILGCIEKDPGIIGPLESLIDDYFSPSRNMTRQDFSEVLNDNQHDHRVMQAVEATDRVSEIEPLPIIEGDLGPYFLEQQTEDNTTNNANFDNNDQLISNQNVTSLSLVPSLLSSNILDENIQPLHYTPDFNPIENNNSSFNPDMDYFNTPYLTQNADTSVTSATSFKPISNDQNWEICRTLNFSGVDFDKNFSRPKTTPIEQLSHFKNQIDRPTTAPLNISHDTSIHNRTHMEPFDVTNDLANTSATTTPLSINHRSIFESTNCQSSYISNVVSKIRPCQQTSSSDKVQQQNKLPLDRNLSHTDVVNCNPWPKRRIIQKLFRPSRNDQSEIVDTHDSVAIFRPIVFEDGDASNNHNDDFLAKLATLSSSPKTHDNTNDLINTQNIESKTCHPSVSSPCTKRKEKSSSSADRENVCKMQQISSNRTPLSNVSCVNIDQTVHAESVNDRNSRLRLSQEKIEALLCKLHPEIGQRK